MTRPTALCPACEYPLRQAPPTERSAAVVHRACAMELGAHGLEMSVRLADLAAENAELRRRLEAACGS